jgi:hypothetical protein
MGVSCLSPHRSILGPPRARTPFEPTAQRGAGEDPMRKFDAFSFKNDLEVAERTT